MSDNTQLHTASNLARFTSITELFSGLTLIEQKGNQFLFQDNISGYYFIYKVDKTTQFFQNKEVALQFISRTNTTK